MLRKTKFLLGFGLAIFLSGVVYYYFPNFVDTVRQTGFFMASLVNSQSQEIQQALEEIKEPDEIVPTDQYMDTVQDAKEEISYQDKLDEIADQIDLIRAEIEKLMAEKFGPEYKAEEIAKEQEDQKQEEDLDPEPEEEAEQDLQVVEEAPTRPVVSGGTRAEYPKILISEVQIAGVNNAQEEFVELYNPNDIEVNLTDWYLQRKTKNADSYSTYASNNLFSGKKIEAKSYFIIAREGNFSLSQVDIWVDNPLTEDNSLALKNPNREISDEFSWVNITLPDGLSVGRKVENNSELETQNLTPRSQNSKYIAPINNPVPPLVQESVLKILISEILLGNDEFIELYNPNNTDVGLTDWYLQRKTATGDYGSYVTKTQFEGKNILAGNYFLIARQGSQYENLADIIFDEPLTADNSLVLKNFNREISDKLGFGAASDFELLATVTPEDGKALARKWLESENTEQDTDNNFQDFEIKTPTPKAKNAEPDPIPDLPEDQGSGSNDLFLQ